MPTAFISYYEHIAKLAQIANKQTLFLAHVLSHIEFDKERRLHVADMSVSRKKEIIAEIAPDIEPKKRLNLANQYLQVLKKANLITPVGDGMWAIDPESYGGYKYIPKNLRKENARIFQNWTYQSGDVAVDVEFSFGKNPDDT